MHLEFYAALGCENFKTEYYKVLNIIIVQRIADAFKMYSHIFFVLLKER
jgi:hypothetical protein